MPRVGDALNLTDADKQNSFVVAGMTALSMIAGGVVAQSLGKDAVTAASAAQNEAMNNYLTPKASALLKAAQNNCGPQDPKACEVAQALMDLDKKTRDQMNQLVDACKKGDDASCTQAKQLVNTRDAIAKEQVNSCPPPYDCLKVYQASAQENAAAARQLPGAGSGAVVPTMDPFTAALLVRMGGSNPVIAALSAGTGAAGETIGQVFYGDGSLNYERIANAALISWATGGASASLSSVYSVAGVGAATSAVTTGYNNSQTGSTDSVLASALL